MVLFELMVTFSSKVQVKNSVKLEDRNITLWVILVAVSMMSQIFRALKHFIISKIHLKYLNAFLFKDNVKEFDGFGEVKITLRYYFLMSVLSHTG